jgi:maleate cis-trans isomerase
MKKIAIRINHTVEYELNLMVPDHRDEKYISRLAFACEGLNLADTDKETDNQNCKMIAEYNDLVTWDIVE